MNIYIDGREIEVFPEDTIKSTALRENIFIPGLCNSQFAEGNHSCRLCMVEANEKVVAACGFPAKDGLSVVTNSPRIAKIRATVLKLLYSEAPENPVIMDLMKKYGVDPEPKLLSKENQCILCGLCTAACKKTGISAISTVGRGTTKKVDTPYGQPSQYCTGCASCAEVCPTNCIEVLDTLENRTIWNKKFQWQTCESCGKIITTKELYTMTMALGDMDGPPLCPSCKKRNITDVFAQTFS